MHLGRVLWAWLHLWVHAHALRLFAPAIVRVPIGLLLVLPSGVNVTIWVENLRRGPWHLIVMSLLLGVHILVEALFGVSSGLRFLHLGFLPLAWGEQALHLLI